MTRAANYMRDAVGDEGAQALSDAFNARVPDDWMESQPWRHLALCAEALSSYLFQFGAAGRARGEPDGRRHGQELPHREAGAPEVAVGRHPPFVTSEVSGTSEVLVVGPL